MMSHCFYDYFSNFAMTAKVNACYEIIVDGLFLFFVMRIVRPYPNINLLFYFHKAVAVAQLTFISVIASSCSGTGTAPVNADNIEDSFHIMPPSCQEVFVSMPRFSHP